MAGLRVIFLLLLTLSCAYALPSLKVSTPVLQRSGDSVSVFWQGVTSPTKGDKIALYAPANADVTEYIGYKEVQDCESWSKGYGQLTFTLVNMRVPVLFRYLTNMSDEVATSNVVTFADSNEPLQGHLSLTLNPSEMRVMWVSAASSPVPTVKYVPTSLVHDKASWRSLTGNSTTYFEKDLCGKPANLSYNFLNPGYIHQVLLTNLLLDTYYSYQFGSGESFSEIYKFKTSPGVGKNIGTHFIAYGDLGVKAPYKIKQEVQAPSNKTTTWVDQFIKQYDGPSSTAPIDLVLHIGDISYARGYAFLWEEFFNQIQPISAARPYMVCIGNHEYDWPAVGWRPKWADYGTDSGGECGVPYNKRFLMSGSVAKNYNETSRNLWYSFNYANIHFVFMSTEHEWLENSLQWNYLKEDLASVNREETPFVIFSGHRPLYSSDEGVEESLMNQYFRASIEPLLIKYKVDLALWGHVHTYERTCRLNEYKCVGEEEEGVVHVVIGMAGNQYQTSWGNGAAGENDQPDWSMFRANEWGYTSIRTNSTHLEMSYWGDQDNSLHDRFYIKKQV